MKVHMEIGPCPPEESCVQVGVPDYERLARAECKRYIELIKNLVGAPPSGARLFVKANPHDFGTYYEVAVEYDESSDEAIEYAFKVESMDHHDWNGFVK